MTDLVAMQRTQPWTAPYSDAFEASRTGDPGAAGYTYDAEQHRRLTHDLLHIIKAVGILASIAEWADHGRVRLERVPQDEYEGRVADLVMCALHIANNPPKGYERFDLERAVITRTEAVNGRGFVDYYPKGTVMGDALEAIAAAVHEEWMATKRAGGVTTRCSESGEELMVPYADLSEGAKELDRGSVRAVFNAAETAGYKIVAS